MFDAASGHSSVTPLFDNRSGVDEHTDSLFSSSRYARHQQQHQPGLERSRTTPYSSDTFSDFRPSGLSSFGRTAGESHDSLRGDPRSELDSFRRDHAHELERSHSAAPSFYHPPPPSSRRAVLGPPPGLGVIDRGSNAGGGGNSSYRFDSAVDRSDAIDIRRPASTGVIGHYAKSSSMVLASLGLDEGAVRPTARTLMDLIQEDIPETPLQPDTFDTYVSERIHLDRPRTVSPQRSRESLLYAQREFYEEEDRIGGLAQSMDRLHVRQPEAPGMDRLHLRQPEPYRPSASMVRYLWHVTCALLALVFSNLLFCSFMSRL